MIPDPAAGRASSVALHLYRMRWSLDDVSLAVRDFAARMSRTRTPG
jgi:hypothetical protein